MQEKRKHHRFSLEVSAHIEIPGQENKVVSLITADISAGGAFFRTSEPLAAGTPVKINILLPLDKIRALHDTDHALISVTGSIVRVEAEGMSVSFDSHFEVLPADNLA